MSMLEPQWSPTREELSAYLDREVELCVAALRRDPRLLPGQTLFSDMTFKRARALLETQEETAAVAA